MVLKLGGIITTVKAHLKAASNITGNILTATPDILSDFLNGILETRKAATRNRAWIALSGFYRWARLRRIIPKGHNPLEGIEQLPEEPPTEGIIVWEQSEIPKLLRAADKLKDGITVWIAIHAGLRRNEIAHLEWKDITPAYIIIRKSKNGKQRQVPLSQTLANRLDKETRKGQRVANWPEAFHGWQTAARRLVEERLPALLPAIKDSHPEKFGWNPFRHTFASRHAQAGTPLDIISAWMGNTPKVCREHYARYVPANMRDTRIDIVDAKPKNERDSSIDAEETEP